MNRFEVLDRHQDIQKNYLLEASAGTGKTFSIENIVVRLLVENTNIAIDQILIVTFTRAATRELRMRIHANLEKVCAYLKDCEEGRSEQITSRIDYLDRIVEEGVESIRKTLRTLEQSLSSFDLAQIETIHGFCSKMLTENVLEANYFIDAFSEEELFPKQRMRKIIRDYFRSGISPDLLCEEQLELILKKYNNDDSKIENALLNVLSKGLEIDRASDFNTLFKTFTHTMQDLKQMYGWSSEKIIEDFITLAPFYKNNCNTKRQVKPELIDKVQQFAALIDKDSWEVADLRHLIQEGIPVLDLTRVRIKLSRELPLDQLNYPEFCKELEEKISPLVSFETAFLRMAYDCRELFLKVQNQEEFFSYDDILTSMCSAIKNEKFLTNVRAKFKAAIIDEFQDTDPLQWEIFQKVFLEDGEDKPLLYLVGDPKQSIYAFRQADIYTYLNAGKKIGKENHASLDTNYRSQKSLVIALNTLFQESSCPGLLYLPKNHDWIHYPEVKHAEQTQSHPFKDNKGGIHFFIADENKYSLKNTQHESFFPFIVQEIQHLTMQEGFQYQQIAVLVANRYQAKDLSDFLKKWKIPSVTQKSNSLFQSAAYPCLREVLEATLNPKDESCLKIALGGKIIGWNHLQVRGLDDSEQLETVLYQFLELREILLHDGFAAFFQNLLSSSWHLDQSTVLERLMKEEDNEEFFENLLQVADLLLELDPAYRSTPEFLLMHLSELKALSEGDEEQFKKISDPTQNSVQIVTIHSSKGLEYDVVFALGLANRDKGHEGLIPVEKEGKKYLTKVDSSSSKEYQQYCQEIDAEKMRRLYVAMTRAKYRLYNPVLSVQDNKPLKPATASPMEIFLAKLGQKAPNEDDLYSHIQQDQTEKLRKFIDNLPKDSSITYSLLNEQPFFLQNAEPAKEVNLQQPLTVEVPGSPKFVHSFTSISAFSHSSHLMDLNLDPPHDFQCSTKTAHTLPAGSETGILLHKCLQSYPSEKYRTISHPSDLFEFVSLHTKDTDYEDWSATISELLFNVATTPLIDHFRYTDLSENQCFKECEFLYPSFSDPFPGYIKGFVDLLFEYEGKFYLLDWKSNWLGPSAADYHHEKLRQTMQEHHYFLQASLYTEALKKYLNVVDSRPFSEIFGGILYVFLRGLPQNGIYYFKEEK